MTRPFRFVVVCSAKTSASSGYGFLRKYFSRTDFAKSEIFVRFDLVTADLGEDRGRRVDLDFRVAGGAMVVPVLETMDFLGSSRSIDSSCAYDRAPPSGNSSSVEIALLNP